VVILALFFWLLQGAKAHGVRGVIFFVTSVSEVHRVEVSDLVFGTQGSFEPFCIGSVPLTLFSNLFMLCFLFQQAFVTWVKSG